MIDAVKLIEFNTWANRRIIEQLKTFSNDLLTIELGGSFPSIRLTLLHVLESDWIWMHRWKGLPIVEVPRDWSTNSFNGLVTLWTPIQDQMVALVRDLATDPNKVIAFITKKGASFTMPFLDLVIHVTNHGTYHRGQVVNMIRMLGKQPVNTDYFIFCNLNNK